MASIVLTRLGDGKNGHTIIAKCSRRSLPKAQGDRCRPSSIPESRSHCRAERCAGIPAGRQTSADLGKSSLKRCRTCGPCRRSTIAPPMASSVVTNMVSPIDLAADTSALLAILLPEVDGPDLQGTRSASLDPGFFLCFGSKSARGNLSGMRKSFDSSIFVHYPYFLSALA